LIIGKQITYGDDFVEDTNKDFNLDIKTFLQTHTFLQAMTGAGKTNLILGLVDGLIQERPDVQLIFFDDQEEFTLLPNKYKSIILVSKDRTPKIFSINHAYELGVQSRRKGQSLIIKLSDFAKPEQKEQFVAKFLDGFKSEGKKIGTPCVIIIDEADLFVPTRSKRKNVVSRDPIVWFCKRARKLNISLVLATQFSSAVEIDARREMENYFIGRTKQRTDRNTVCEMLGDNSIFDNLGWGLKKGQFYVRGDALTQDLKLIQTKETKIEKKLAGVQEKESLSDLSKIYEQSLTEHTNLSLLEMLQKKIDDLEKELTVTKSKELTEEIRKHLIDIGFNEGFRKAKQQEEDEKGKVTKFLEKL